MVPRVYIDSSALIKRAVDEECPISSQVVSLARRTGPPVLRRLDAIHLSTATLIDADVGAALRRLLSA